MKKLRNSCRVLTKDEQLRLMGGFDKQPQKATCICDNGTIVNPCGSTCLIARGQCVSACAPYGNTEVVIFLTCTTC